MSHVGRTSHRNLCWKCSISVRCCLHVTGLCGGRTCRRAPKRLYAGICVRRCSITEQAVCDCHALRLLAEVGGLLVGTDFSCNDDRTSVRQNLCLLLTHVGRTSHRNLCWKCSISVRCCLHVTGLCGGRICRMTSKRRYAGICVRRCSIAEQAVYDCHARRLLAEMRCLLVGKEFSCNYG